MDSVIGRIGQQAELTESVSFDAPTRIINVTDASGRVHGRVQWLSAEMGEGFERGIHMLYVEATEEVRASRSPSAAS